MVWVDMRGFMIYPAPGALPAVRKNSQHALLLDNTFTKDYRKMKGTEQDFLTSQDRNKDAYKMTSQNITPAWAEKCALLDKRIVEKIGMLIV